MLWNREMDDTRILDKFEPHGDVTPYVIRDGITVLAGPKHPEQVWNTRPLLIISPFALFLFSVQPSMILLSALFLSSVQLLPRS
jgi:hypothetical protein